MTLSVDYRTQKFKLKDSLLLQLLNFSFWLAESVYLFIFHNTQCILVELSLLSENLWHHDNSINQTLNSYQHSFKLSVLE